jgi:hypothetical protein
MHTMRWTTGGAVLLAVLSSAACHTIKPVSMDELKAIQPKQAWVTASDQSVVIVSGPQVMGDTLVGYVKGVYEEMPAAELKEVRIEKPATSKTVMLVSAITVGFAGMVYALAGSGKSGKDQSDTCDKNPDYPECV